MADDDASIKLLIEAEDRSRDAFEKAKQNTDALKKSEADLWKTINDGQKTAAMSGKEYFAMRHQAVQTGNQLQRSYGTQSAALQQLVQAHNAVTAAVQKHGQAATGAFGAAGQALASYAKHFVSIGAVEEILRRSITTFAEFERGMARIELESGATAKQVNQLGHAFDSIARTTGQEMGKIQQDFQTFRAQIGGSLGEVKHLFEDVQNAAHASGVSFETMSKTAVAAVKTMGVPMGEVKGMLDVIVKDIPASAMSAWDNVAPRILGIMRSLGGTGKQSAEQAATAFGLLSTALGSAAQAGSVQEQLLRKATDQSTMFGKVMTPQLIALQNQMGGVTKSGEAMYQTMAQMGMFDEDPQKALFMQQRFGFSDEMVRGAEAYHKTFLQVTEEVKKTGEAFDVVEKRILRLNQGPLAAINSLQAAFKELLTAIGGTIDMVGGTALISGIAKMISFFASVSNAMQHPLETLEKYNNLIKSLIENLNKYYGFSASGKDGAPRTPWLPDTAPKGMPYGAGKPGGAAALGNKLGFAEGGSFEVGGAGGIDREPVGFMATRGERVDVTTATQESLQLQQDKADIASREHFARFHGTAFTKTKTDAWPGSGRELGKGTGAAGGGSPYGNLPGMGGAPGYGSGRGGGGDGTGSGSGNDGTGTTESQLKTPVGVDPASATGPAENLTDAYARGYLTPPTSAVSGSAYLAQERQHLVDQYKKDPGLKVRVAAMASLEQEGDANLIVESLYNRINLMKSRGQGYAKNGSIDAAINSGFYGPINKGALAQRVRELQRDPARLAKIMAKIDQAHTGNVLEGATDQGSGNDPNVNWQGGRKVINREVYNDWDGPGGHAGSRKYREDQQAKVRAAGNVEPAQGSAPGQTPISNIAKAVRAGQVINAEGNVVEDPTATAGSSGTSGSGRVFEKQNAPGVTRVLPIQHKLKEQLEYAAAESGVEVDVFSGGQHAPFRTKSGKMTSHRHDKDAAGMGGAADIKLYVRNPDGTRRLLNSNNPADAIIMRKFTRESVRAGATGVGHGDNYMGPESLHIGGGSKASWGGSNWIEQERLAGEKTKLTPQQFAEARARQTAAKATETAAKPPDNKPAAAPTNTKVATAAPAVGQKTDAQLDKASGKGSKPYVAPAGEGKAAGKNLGTASVAESKATAAAAAGGAAAEARQWGGDVRAGRPYTVGEGGPETFIPSSPGHISPGGMDVGSMLSQYRQFASELSKPITPNLQMPRMGPIQQRMSRRVEQQRGRDTSRMARHDAHSDIGFA